MTNAYKRKKQPELVRKTLMEQALRIALEQGLHAVTVQAVADAAGVTKGGFLHHFASKQDLLDAIFHGLVGDLEARIDSLMASDGEAYGSFTRAYVEAVMEDGWEGDSPVKGGLSSLMIGDARMRALWADWYNRRQERHRDTDGAEELCLLRLAADGIWLARLSKVDLPDKAALRERLLQATRPLQEVG
ncbi:TetR/AcrR family transcriptional regulator [Telmatospirillum sp. J64-1]|uniref:TetR/AcrR family transcriptional regulator n=1 Tax=Telmatospirillum sp. J64-1 TaxID=2502183 RepID=UPI00115ED379|nr:TetR/AcrR family transcriptional regulator [Telmatospirillum sp. J64-1]